MDSSPCPVARTDDLLVVEVDDETLVYDVLRHRAHYLNPIAGIVWRLCDGKTSLDRITQAVAEATGTDEDQDIVWYALRRLNGARLLAGPLRPDAGARTLSRRELVRRVTAAGLGLMVLPTVTSILTPTTLQAQASCIPPGAPCVVMAGQPCCPGFQCTGPNPHTCK